MEKAVQSRAADPNSESIRPVIENLLAEYKRVRDERDAATLRLAKFAENIRALARGMGEFDRASFERQLADLQGGHSIQNRGGDFFGKVVSIFSRQAGKEWSVPALFDLLKKQGDSPDQKALYNTINYLASTGRLRRVARGRYVLANGAAIEFEAPNDGTVRQSEHDT